MPVNDTKNEPVSTLLAQIAARTGISQDPASDPKKYISALYEAWRKNGGKVSGKTRHSIRYLESGLSSEDTPIRSLTTKLRGDTKIKPIEGGTLVSFFLKNWWPEERNGETIYTPLLNPEVDIPKIAGYIQNKIRTLKTKPATVETAMEKEGEESGPGELLSVIISSNYAKCDALITVSSEHTLINSTHEEELIGFRNLIDRMYNVYKKDTSRRPLIWLIDVGNFDYNEFHESRQKYLNLHMILTRFKALRDFTDPVREERWKWLLENTTFIVFDSHNKKQNNLSFASELQKRGIFFEVLPVEWLRDSGLRALYGKNLEEKKYGTFSVFFSMAQRFASNEDFQCYGYAAFKTGEDGNELRGLNLPSLPDQYADGFRAVCAAAKHVLKLPAFESKAHPKENDDYVDMPHGEKAVAQLAALGAVVLKLDEFIEKY